MTPLPNGNTLFEDMPVVAHAVAEKLKQSRQHHLLFLMYNLRFTLFLLGLLFSACLIAQTQPRSTEKLLPSSFEKTDNFFEVQQNVTRWWESLSDVEKELPENSRQYKKYKRWEIFWETRVESFDGSLRKAAAAMTQAVTPTQNLSTLRGGSSSQWNPIGMFEPNTSNHCQDGVGRIISVAFHPNYTGTYAFGQKPAGNENTLFAGGDNGGLWQSKDGGQLWENMNTDYLANIRVKDLVISSNQPSEIYFAGSVFFSSYEGFGHVNHHTTMSIYRTADGGTNWNLCGAPFDYQSNGNSGNFLHDIELCVGKKYKEKEPAESRGLVFPTPPDVLLAASDLGVHRSTDKGQSWNLAWANVPTNYSLGPRKIRISPSQPSRMYLGGQVDWDDFTQGHEADDIYWSSNKGQSWSLWQTIAKYGTSPADDNDLNLRLNPSMRGRVHGEIQILRHDLLISHQDANKIYVVVEAINRTGSTYDDGVITNWANDQRRYWLFVTTDGGQNWASLWRGDAGHPFKFAAYKVWNISPTNDDALFIGTLHGSCSAIYRRSLDGGQTFQVFTGQNSANYNNGHIHADIREIAFSPGGHPHMLFGTDGGLNLSRDPHNLPAAVFDNVTGFGLSVFQAYRLACAETYDVNVLAAGPDVGSSMRTSLNGAWNHVGYGDGTDCAVDFTDANTFYTSSQHGNFRRVVNGSGTGINPPGAGGGEWITPIAMDHQDHETIYLGYNDLYKSTDQGDNWAQISSNPHSENITHIAVAPSDPNVVYYAIKGTFFNPDRLFKTSDGGQSWVTLTFDPNSSSHVGSPAGSDFTHNRWISGLSVSPTDAHTLYVAYCGFDNTPPNTIPLKKVTRIVYDPGNQVYTWRLWNKGLPDQPVNCITTDNSTGQIFIGTDRGVYGRMPTGQLWTLYGTGLPNTMIMDLDVAETSGWLRAGTYGRGVWEIDLGYGTKSYRKGQEISFAKSSLKDFSFDIAPNPVIEQFSLSYTLSTQLAVDISLMDLHGKWLQKVQENELQPAGTYQHTIDLSQHPRGVYLIMVVVEGKIYSRKVIKTGL
jgi:photosystem II stability/assembly factor-like uncharacterized protein